ncbi:putative calcium load-activated calcium channel [Paratrimastix pyriformis]|uniref:Calcium load-activated calcium channel n=1 Tax=Paratrimastix pyriformis TaxID=342808 RepID=A0ABQ8UKJ5_9EUKA|nr:putative calcium load-activated calcium channel [Paratrimastix pyriformis]
MYGGIFVLLFSLFTASLSEGISYVLIYRTENYKQKKSQIEKLNQRMRIVKEAACTMEQQVVKKKKIAVIEQELQQANQSMMMMKTKSHLFSGILVFLMNSLVNSIWEGAVIAKLPFVPIKFVRGFSHRNILGEDWTECGTTFIYLLSSMSLRVTLQKLLGFAPPRGQGLMGMPSMQDQQR